MPSRSCPSDQQPMQVLRVAAAGREVEIDRCSGCGSVWFDAGELELVAEVSAARSAVESGAQCPVCAQPMAYARLKGELGAQVCYRCHGTFVEGSVLAALKSASHPPAPTGLQPDVSFQCTNCGSRAPFVARSGGGVCTDCVASSAPADTRGASAIDVAAGALDLANLVFLVFF